jgi:hypothetical protein
MPFDTGAVAFPWLFVLPEIGVFQPMRKVSLIRRGFQDNATARQGVNTIRKGDCLFY